MRVATVFSGVGAFEHALMKLEIDHEIVFACDNGERHIDIDVEGLKAKLAKLSNAERRNYVKKLYDETKKKNHVKETYMANYKIDESKWYEDIRFIDGKEYNGKVDLFVGGSPCQSFSAIGKRKGLKDARGTLFYDYARLIREIQPKAFIFENVPGLLNHNNGDTWQTIHAVFNDLKYTIHKDILNSINFGIPQNRRRLFVIGIRDSNIPFAIPKESQSLENTVFDYLEDRIPARHYLGKKGFEFVTNPKYANRAQVNRKVIRTQKANQQFNWNGDFIFQDYSEVKGDPEILNRAHVGNWNGRYGVIRQLTHRECFRLMGFSDDFKIVSPNVEAYRQSGNSIVVNVFESIIKELLNTKALSLQ
jgi:DNA (cytosine-5)-methyltransferase 1